MTPSHTFVEDLRVMGESLVVKYVNWREGLDENEEVTVWPIKGSPFSMLPNLLPQSGRFVIYELNSINGRLERVFDVVYPDGHFMPLDHRAMAGPGLRRMWSNMEAKALAALREETMEREAAATRAATTSALRDDQRYTDAMVGMHRAVTGGLGLMALGAPGAPAAARVGTRALGVEYEATVGPPPKEVKPKHESFTLVNE